MYDLGVLPAWVWDREGSEATRMSAGVTLNGVMFHVTAIAVKQNDEDTQVAVNSEHQEEFERLYDAAGGDGPVSTMRIGDSEYAVYLDPFC